MTTTTQHRIYVASSWRNTIQPDVVAALRRDGHEVYDFKNPAPGDNGFSWRQIGDRSKWDAAYFATEVLDHPIAAHGFGLDMRALEACSACVLVLPCGRSAHLELGQAVGARKLTIVYMPELEEPELMYRMCDYVETTLDGVRRQLSSARAAPRWQADLEEAEGRGFRTSDFAGRCGPYRHRTCAVCGGCWRHGSCTCGPEVPREAPPAEGARTR